MRDPVILAKVKAGRVKWLADRVEQVRYALNMRRSALARLRKASSDTK